MKTWSGDLLSNSNPPRPADHCFTAQKVLLAFKCDDGSVEPVRVKVISASLDGSRATGYTVHSYSGVLLDVPITFDMTEHARKHGYIVQFEPTHIVSVEIAS